MNEKEGNIISFRVFIDRKGNLVTEFKNLPVEKVPTVLYKEDPPFVQKVIREATPKLEILHEYLEKELSALR